MTDITLHKLPTGFQTAGITCGIKDSGKPDLSIFVSKQSAISAGVFTQNLVCGAPVTVSKERVGRESSRAVVINSGNANACTGEQGIKDAQAMTAKMAEVLGCDSEDVLVCSTGIIGHFLPMDKILSGVESIVPQLGGESPHLQAAAEAIMTTDTFAKISSREVIVNGKQVRITGVCKGAAMIAPNMATMLSVIMTDAELTTEQADSLLRHAVNRSFNCVSVEGHTSTSDTVLLLANGAAKSGSVDDMLLGEFGSALDQVSEELAQMIIRDAEGADHFVTIDVTGLDSYADAYKIAKAVAEGPLVKTAITGNDPNWGRIVSAAGYAGVPFDPLAVTLHLNQTLLYEQGQPVEYEEEMVSKSMQSGEVHITLKCGEGPENIRFWTCDLTQEYVRLNSEYTT
ncbi:bifunctional glutamate N-acetyltransferase/amino-acid acetyltransferase ArgJ [Planctomycetaceae bacterium]|jgi:glutamate N-acetyltransferase / amino-acid N-acetyltransferase|nr:bifunctional glutamate N-acetyltransferase/amino-acid acetyltransferase ArgJ [Planctomycetaceae bacterium]MDC0273455.1 bifunctional glutamate N-acetyltransferase/amino-acid acetyltransferase ArgJ [Planctomycetaceae bacterium]MDC0308530.1 bifunctional glutamate N-acetyltransferase/amino-acid acetyltransferase ArgJ [Planctomycetaceae bacterium]MDG2390690.1 bifunctional glutamate N-acetyltransferase/amino-acid acetyltransferase ArgJ [Planctomycetaceae bacterium]